jgi:hypothetical protein
VNLLKEFPNAKTVTMWDDRVEHKPEFIKFLDGLVKDGKIEDYNFIEVHNPQWTK